MSAFRCQCPQQCEEDNDLCLDDVTQEGLLVRLVPRQLHRCRCCFVVCWR